MARITMAFQQQVPPALTLKTVCIVLAMLCCDALAEDVIKTKDVSVSLRQAMERGEKAIRFEVRGEDFELVRIPPGEFLLGSPETESGREASEGPVRQIKITKPFYLGRYEVTQRQFLTVIDGDPNRANDALPTYSRRYWEIFDFNRKLSQLIGVRVTLPTEAMWEYACRAGSKNRYCNGDTEKDLDKVAWFEANSNGRPHAVGQKEPNAWGLYDMHGNVPELCADILLDYDTIPNADPVGRLIDPPKPFVGTGEPEGRPLGFGAGTIGCLRGGTFCRDASLCRATRRAHVPDRFTFAGIRICIEPHRLNDGPEQIQPKAEGRPESPAEDPFQDVTTPKDGSSGCR
jgi:formylglycine-generating enzyme required for sulfatase activity